MMDRILSVQNLAIEFENKSERVRAVDGVNFCLERGKTLCLVGESGCGKSVSSLSILRLLPEPPAEVVSGQVTFEGRNLLDLPVSELRKVRGNEISMIFQEPMTALNPVFTIGNQIVEAILQHRPMSRDEAKARAIDGLRDVGIPVPEERLNDYPHQLSGGMRQRVMIAMALACEPKVLIADEPTTALDVTIQAQILNLLRSIQRKTGLALLLITHDLGVVAEMADEVAVMYAGQIVETGPVDDIFQKPLHPYTQGLLQSIPRRDQERLDAIQGMVPDLRELPTGCRFRDRCSKATGDCEKTPPLTEHKNGGSNGRVSRCVLGAM